MRGASTRQSHDFFCLLICRQPVWPLRTEKTADFGVESLDPTANLCPSSKIPFFITHIGGGGLKSGIFKVLGWMVCLSATACKEHRICTQKAWIISGDVLDVSFEVISDPKNNGTPMGTTEPQTFLICFIAHRLQKYSLISTVSLFSKSDKN